MHARLFVAVPGYSRNVDPADAAELARRMRAAVVEETPRRWYALPATIVLVGAIVMLVARLLH